MHAVDRADDVFAPGPDRTLDARLVNLDERPVTARIVGPYEPRARRLRLDGTPARATVRIDAIPLRPCEILTLRLRAAGSRLQEEQ